MKKRLSVNEWMQHYYNGDWDDASVKTQIEAGWYDWFCKDSCLRHKTLKMGRIIQGITDPAKVNFRTMYVWFKNNCPLNGLLYDDFRFADIETGEVQFTVQIDCCWNRCKYTVWGRTPDGEFHNDKPLLETDSIGELRRWFNTPWHGETAAKEEKK